MVIRCQGECVPSSFSFYFKNKWLNSKWHLRYEQILSFIRTTYIHGWTWGNAFSRYFRFSIFLIWINCSNGNWLMASWEQLPLCILSLFFQTFCNGMIFQFGYQLTNHCTLCVLCVRRWLSHSIPNCFDDIEQTINVTKSYLSDAVIFSLLHIASSTPTHMRKSQTKSTKKRVLKNMCRHCRFILNFVWQSKNNDTYCLQCLQIKVEVHPDQYDSVYVCHACILRARLCDEQWPWFGSERTLRLHPMKK